MFGDGVLDLRLGLCCAQCWGQPSISRYVHQNPVWTGGWKGRPILERIRYLRAYKWSSYPGYIGQGKQWEFVDEEPILGMMGGSQGTRRKAYREFVETGLATGDDLNG